MKHNVENKLASPFNDDSHVCNAYSVNNRLFSCLTLPFIVFHIRPIYYQVYQIQGSLDCKGVIPRVSIKSKSGRTTIFALEIHLPHLNLLFPLFLFKSLKFSCEGTLTYSITRELDLNDQITKRIDQLKTQLETNKEANKDQDMVYKYPIKIRLS